MNAVSKGLYCVKLRRVYVHIIEEVYGKYSLVSREDLNNLDASIVTRKYLAPDLSKPSLRTMRQMHEMVVT
jgi:hypothetical protein